MEDYLIVLAEEISWQVGMSVGGEAYSVAYEGVADFFLSVCSVDAICVLTVTVVVRMNLRKRDNRNAPDPCPGHDPSDVSQHPAMVPDAGFSVRYEKVSLCIYIYKNLFASRSNQLENHLTMSFLGLRA